MDKYLWNLKMAVKQMERAAKKCEKEAQVEKNKIKKDLAKGMTENARIHAENAIRQKNQHTQYLRMAARVDAVAQRVQTAVTTKQVTKSMQGVVVAMDKAMRSMNLQQITQLMDDFERQFENLDVQIQVMDGSMQATTSTTMPEGQVDGLMQEVADQHGLELGDELALPNGSVSIGTSSAANREQDELTERLAKLRGE